MEVLLFKYVSKKKYTRSLKPEYLFVHAKNNFIQRLFLPVFFWICTKDACSFRQKEVFPRMRAACNINYHFHYALTISCLMWSLTVINPGITFDYLIEIWILWKYILLMFSCVICSFFHQEYSKWSDAHIFSGKFGHNFYCTLGRPSKTT